MKMDLKDQTSWFHPHTYPNKEICCFRDVYECHQEITMSLHSCLFLCSLMLLALQCLPCSLFFSFCLSIFGLLNVFLPAHSSELSRWWQCFPFTSVLVWLIFFCPHACQNLLSTVYSLLFSFVLLPVNVISWFLVTSFNLFQVQLYFSPYHITMFK